MDPGPGSPGGDAAGGEVERLRDRVAGLEQQLAAAQASTATAAAPEHPHRLRSVVAVVLVAVGCLLAPLAVVAVWVTAQLQDADRYVEMVGPLAQDPAVQAAVTTAVTQQVVTALDVETVVRRAVDRLEGEGLPPEAAQALDLVGAPIAAGVESFVRDQVAAVVTGERFAAVWAEANRIGHDQLIGVLSGDQEGLLVARDDAVVLDLAPLVVEVTARSEARGLGLAAAVPEVSTSFVLVESEALGRMQLGYRLVTALGVWLPVAAVGLMALGVAVAPARRRAVVGAGLGVAASMLVLGVALVAVRLAYLDAVPPTTSQEAARAVFDTLVRLLRDSLRVTAVVGLLVALVAFLGGPSPTAVRTRRTVVGGIARARGRGPSHGDGRAASWTAAHRPLLRPALLLVAAAVVVLWSDPTVAVVLWVAALALVALVLVEVAAATAAPPPPATAPEPDEEVVEDRPARTPPP